MYVMWILSKYCPKCEIFKHGYLARHKDGERRDIYYKTPYKGGYKTVNDICYSIGVSYTEMEVGIDYDLPSLPIVSSKGMSNTSMTMNQNRVWLSKMIGRSTIELPGFYIKSNIGRDRYVNIEIVNEASGDAPKANLISQWGSVRQCLRNMARTSLEERLKIKYGYIDDKIREGLLNKLFPNEIGDKEPDELKWIEGFVKVRRMKLRD